MANEIGRLAQGVRVEIEGTNAIEFIHNSEVPKHKKVTYSQIVADVKPSKDEKHWVLIKVGRDRSKYEDDLYTPTVDIKIAKLLFNSAISTRNARFATDNIKNFYLATPLDDPST